MSIRFNFTYLLLIVFLGTLLYPYAGSAQSIETLRSQIEAQNAQIAAIEAEIAKYERDLTVVGKDKQTLENAVQQLDISRRKISASVEAARSRITATELELQELSGEIGNKETAIDRSNLALSETLRRIHQTDNETFVEALLRSEKISSVWDDIETVQQFQEVMRNRIVELSVAKVELVDAHETSAKKRSQLIVQTDDLAAQKQALDINRKEKNSLLAETKDKESNYQALLAEKRAAKAEFEDALLDLESKLEYTLDPSKVPPVGKGVLRWPLDSVTITQHFGNTEFAQSGAYSGQGHNGVDFRASVGTPVKSALNGTVQATGNTDQYAGCYSYGKWVLVRHSNGLSSLYAHLSHITVSSGESVNTGNIIGYSGNTGYSTGPHLHFTVYESNAVQLVRLGDVKRITNCANATIPIAPLKAYLNPLDYL